MNQDGERQSKSPYVVLGTLTAGCVLALVILYVWVLGEDAERQRQLVTEIGKGLIQVIAIGVIGGGLIKFLLDDHQRSQKEASDEQIRIQQRQEQLDDREQQRQEQLQAFRTDKIRRLVQVTNTLRRAPILIDAHRTAKTYNEQMRAVVDAGLELRLIRHEINALGSDKNPAFAHWPDIRRHIRSMEEYIAWLQDEFRKHSKTLSELQVAAENERHRQSEVWEEIRNLESVRDLLEEVTDRSGPYTREAGPDTRYARQYLKGYETAMTLMIRASVLDPIPPEPRVDLVTTLTAKGNPNNADSTSAVMPG